MRRIVAMGDSTIQYERGSAEAMARGMDVSDDLLVEGIVLVAQTSSRDHPQGVLHASSCVHGAMAVGLTHELLRRLTEQRRT